MGVRFSQPSLDFSTEPVTEGSLLHKKDRKPVTHTLLPIVAVVIFLHTDFLLGEASS